MSKSSKAMPVVAMAAAVALLGAACGGDDGGDAVTLTAAELAWDPGTLTVPSGGSIELVNEDDAKHNLTIEEAGVDEDVEGGDSVTVDLSDVEPGSYDFVCEYHSDTMTGTIEVE